jgi:hypothetical protein
VCVAGTPVHSPTIANADHSVRSAASEGSA